VQKGRETLGAHLHLSSGAECNMKTTIDLLRKDSLVQQVRSSAAQTIRPLVGVRRQLLTVVSVHWPRKSGRRRPLFTIHEC
jgi:hypothetical protein